MAVYRNNYVAFTNKEIFHRIIRGHEFQAATLKQAIRTCMMLR